jgi:hypothetical protein
MKYFTPDLLGRFGSEDDAIALGAQEELENRSAQYTEYLKHIRDKLPERFRELQERFYLHDARVISPWLPFLVEFPFHPPIVGLMEWLQHGGWGRGPWPSFFLTLELDTPPREVLVLNYRDVVIDEASRHRPFQTERVPYYEWQHDEIEIAQENGVNRIRHSILFSNGFELRLQFGDFDFATLKPLRKLVTR